MADFHGTKNILIIPLLFSEYSEPWYPGFLVSICKSSLWSVNRKSLLNRGPDSTPIEISKLVLLQCMHYDKKNKKKIIEKIKTNSKEVWGKSAVIWTGLVEPPAVWHPEKLFHLGVPLFPLRRIDIQRCLVWVIGKHCSEPWDPDLLIVAPFQPMCQVFPPEAKN